MTLAHGGGLVWSCPGGERPFVPTGVAFGTQGELYVTDADNGAVFRIEGDRCAALAEGWSRPFGVVVLDDGRICVSHFTADDPLTREAAVSCWGGSGWTLEARGLGSGVNGLAATSEGLWLAAWEDTPVEARAGVLLLIDGGSVKREVRLEDGVPRFLASRPDGGLLVTVVHEDASGVTGGAVLTWSPDGRLERLGIAVERPAGVAWTEHGVWVADDGSDRLMLLTPEGRRSIHPRPLQGASGLAVSEVGDVCVAEPRGGLVTCFGSESMLETRGAP